MDTSEDNPNPNLFDTLFYAETTSELEGIDASIEDIDLETDSKERMKDAITAMEDELSKFKSLKGKK